jgi:hypothetical protein
MLNYLRSGKRPTDARDLLVQISAQYPDRERALRVFIAAVYDDPRYVRACIEHAFETRRSRAPQ